jgi:hypothetical protein
MGVRGTGHSTRDFWGNIATQGMSLVNNIFASRSPNAQLAPAQQLALAQAQAQAAATAASGGNPPGVGFGVDGQGLRLSDGSHIGWSTIGIAGLAFYLIQSKGFEKRR